MPIECFEGYESTLKAEQTMKESDLCDWAAVERMSLLDVRDKVVDCLVEHKGDYFRQSRMALGLDSGDSAVRASAQGIVKVAFETAGGSYEFPSLDVLPRVVNVLTERFVNWGAEPEQIFECHCHLMQEIGRLELTSNAGVRRAIDGN